MTKKNMKDKFIIAPEGWEDVEVVEFLDESNRIEGVTDIQALEDAIDAWNYAFVNRAHIDLDYILEIHRLLAQHIEPEIAGKVRDCDVWIDGKCKMFISESLLKEQLNEYIRNTKITGARKKLEDNKKESLVKKWHIEFEGLHPFVDFNGRSGRTLMQIHRLGLGLPLKIIHNETKATDYYPWFRTN